MSPKTPSNQPPTDPGVLERLMREMTAELGEMRRERRALVDHLGEEMLAALYEIADHVRPAATESGRQVGYRHMLRRVRSVVRASVPADATIAVVSRGDEELLHLFGRRARHFPEDADGRWAGYHPANDACAVVMVEAARAGGATHLLLPETALWWLDHYQGLRDHLTERYEEAVREEGTCVIFSIARPAALPLDPARGTLASEVEDHAARLRRSVVVLDWDTGVDFGARLDGATVFRPPERCAELPYLDASIDLVAVSDARPDRLGEANRVATSGVIHLPSTPGTGAEPARIEWKDGGVGVAPADATIVMVLGGPYPPARMVQEVLGSLPRGFDGSILALAGPDIEAEVRSGLGQASVESRVEVVSGSTMVGGVLAEQFTEVGDHRAPLVLLGPGVVPLRGWLAALTRGLQSRPAVGVVAGKIVTADGQLDEAGSLQLADGSVSRRGWAQPLVGMPQYEHLRPVELTSGRLTAVDRLALADVGGFDPRYRSLGGAVADLCIRLRAGKHVVLYQPTAVAIDLGTRIVGRSGAISGRLADPVELARLAARPTAGPDGFRPAPSANGHSPGAAPAVPNQGAGLW